MKLSDATNMTLEESALFIEGEPLLEDGEGPRWKFRYDNFNVDPTPDILLLGAYRHPNTGNNLVGGINLHYLSSQQVEKLAKALPEIMTAGNLKSRYWKGRSLVPDVFNDYYRTYDSKYIRGVEQDIMYPKYGFLKTAKSWLKKKLANIFRTKKQREKEAQPEYPDDLQQMQTRLNDVVAQLQQQQPERPSQEPADTPEMRRARDAFQQFQREKAKQALGLDTDDEILKRNMDDYIDQQTQEQPVPERPTPEPTPEERAEEFKQERQQNQRELLNPDNELDPDLDLEESIIYFSPLKGRYVTEKFVTEAIVSLERQLMMLRPEIAKAAQAVYDQWETDDEELDPVVGGGGICDEIAQAIGEVLLLHDIDYTDGGHDGDDHAYLIAYDNESAYVVDIAPQNYESGGGMVWTKIPNITFTPEMVEVIETYRPDWIDEDDLVYESQV